jgi:hypothetical protein
MIGGIEGWKNEGFASTKSAQPESGNLENDPMETISGQRAEFGGVL